MISIEVPDYSNTPTTVSLGGRDYTFYFRYNSITQRYYLDIYFGRKPIIFDLKLVEFVRLLYKYDLPDFNHGDLQVIRVNRTEEKATFGNIGFDKDYRFLYIPNEEL